MEISVWRGFVMKKRFSIILIVCMLFSLFACGSPQSVEVNRALPEEEVTEAVVEETATADVSEEEITEEEKKTEQVVVSSGELFAGHETIYAPPMTEDSTFEIFYLDVGQGDASCILCDGQAMLIDGGAGSESDKIYSFLKAHDIGHLDYIVATHPDADHIGGLAGALNYATVGTAYCTVKEYQSEPFNDFLKYLGQRDAQITVPKAGETFYLGCAKVTIVYPEAGETRTDNTSIMLRIQYGETSFLFTGDCEIRDEAAALSTDYDLKSDVLKVAHHGSGSSTGPLLLKYVRPKYAVISVGGTNNYGHPTETVLTRLRQWKVSLFRTDMQGDIHCTSNGADIIFDVEKNADIDTYTAAGGYQNYLDAQAAAAAEASKPSEIPLVEQTPQPTEEDLEKTTPEEPEARVTYIANLNTKKFHKPTCASVDRMNEANKWYFTGTREELINQGYDPCKNCNP